MNLFELVAVLSLNKKGYEEGLDSAEKEASSFGSKLKSGLGTVAKVGGASLAVLGAGATMVTKSLIGTSSEVAQLGDHIDKQSQKIGISAKAYQEWDFILTHSGASVDSLQASMKTLSKQAQDNAEEFEALGISQEEVQNSSPEELFERVIKGLQGMEAGTERTAIASKLLGRGATELAPVLNSTSDDIEEMRNQAHELGKVLSDEAVKSGAAYEDSLYNLQTSISGIKNKMASELLPSIVNVMDGLTGVFSGDSGAVKKVSEGISSLMDKISQTIPRIAEIASTLITTFGNAIIQNLPALTKSAIKIVNTLVASIMDNLPMIIDMGLEIIMALVDGLIDAFPQLVEGLIHLVLKVVEKLPAIIKKLITAIPKMITMFVKALTQNLPLIIQGLVSLVIDIVRELPTIISELISNIPTIITMLIDGFLNAIPQLVQGAIQLVVELVKHLPEIIAGLIGAIPEILSSILSAFGPLGDMLGGLFSGFMDSIGGILGGMPDMIGPILEEAYNVASGIFEWFGHLMDDPAGALKEAFDGVKSYAVKVFESLKTIVTGIFDLIDAKKAEAEAKERGEKIKQEIANIEQERGMKLVHEGNTSYWALDDKEKYLNYYGHDALGLVEKAEKTSKVDVSGKITHEGVNNEGELVASADYTMDNLASTLEKEARLGGY